MAAANDDFMKVEIAFCRKYSFAEYYVHFINSVPYIVIRLLVHLLLLLYHFVVYLSLIKDLSCFGMTHQHELEPSHC